MWKMKILQPEMQSIQERYKDDKVRQQQAIMELYKTQGVNPMLGCVPVLLQIPVFFALYKVLYTTLEMRHPAVLGLGPRFVGARSHEPVQSVWAAAVSRSGLHSVSASRGLADHHGFHDVAADEAQSAAARSGAEARLFSIMPIMFTFMLGTAPAGLVIYWCWNNSLTILQQSTIMKRQGVKVELFDNVRKSFGEAVATVRGWLGRSSPPLA